MRENNLEANSGWSKALQLRSVITKFSASFAMAVLIVAGTLIVGGVFNTSSNKAYAQSTLWLNQFGTASDDIANGVATDSSGTYVVGYTHGSLNGTNQGGLDAFLRKYDSSGNVIWTKQIGSAGTDVANGVAVDSSGIYVVGQTSGALDFANLGGNDAFIVKYDLSGNQLWINQFGTTDEDFANGVAVDSSGVYVVGNTYGALDGTNQGGSDAIVRKYDSSGNVVWTRQYGFAGDDVANAVSLDAAGVYVAGNIGVDSGQIPVLYIPHGLILKYSKDGLSIIWSKTVGGQFSNDEEASFAGVASDSGGVYAFGTDNTQCSCDSPINATLYHYATDGNLLWSRFFGPPQPATDISQSISGNAIALDSTGVYVAGGVLGPLDGTSQGGGDAFIRKYDSSGSLQWGRQLGTAGDESADGVAVGASGVYMVGATNGALTGANLGGVDAYIIKLEKSAPDVTPPVVTVTPDRSPDSNGYYNHAVTFTVTGDDSTTGNSNPVTCNGPITYSGPETSTATTVSGSCIDSASNNSTGQSVSFKYDSVKPTIAITSPNGAYFAGTSLTVQGTASDATSGLASVTVSIDDQTAVTASGLGSWSTTFGGLTAGSTHTVVATVTDMAGNTQLASLTITSDNSQPETKITGAFNGKGQSLKNGTTTTDTGVKFFFQGLDNHGISKLQCSLDGATFADCTSPVSYSHLQSSITHTFRVKAIDLAGNTDTSPAFWVWKINPQKLK